MARPLVFLGSGFPCLTAAEIVVIGATTAAALFDPALLALLGRRPGALANGEWWRLVTPLLVHDGGWTQIVGNLLTGAIAGTVVERVLGRGAWVVLFFTGGITGEIAGVFWQPVGAGTSVAIYGLAGGLIAGGLTRPGLPPQPRFGAAVGLAGAIVLSLIGDIHGPPAIVGTVLGLALARR